MHSHLLDADESQMSLAQNFLRNSDVYLTHDGPNDLSSTIVKCNRSNICIIIFFGFLYSLCVDNIS